MDASIAFSFYHRARERWWRLPVAAAPNGQKIRQIVRGIAAS